MNCRCLNRKVVLQIATLPLYLFFSYIFMLGLDEFFDRNPQMHSALLVIVAYAFPIVASGVISWRFIQAKRAFQEGLREGQRRNVIGR